jgi:hypothetical protein
MRRDDSVNAISIASAEMPFGFESVAEAMATNAAGPQTFSTARGTASQAGDGAAELVHFPRLHSTDATD